MVGESDDGAIGIVGVVFGGKSGECTSEIGIRNVISFFGCLSFLSNL